MTVKHFCLPGHVVQEASLNNNTGVPCLPHRSKVDGWSQSRLCFPWLSATVLKPYGRIVSQRCVKSNRRLVNQFVGYSWCGNTMQHESSQKALGPTPPTWTRQSVALANQLAQPTSLPTNQLNDKPTNIRHTSKSTMQRPTRTCRQGSDKIRT